MAKARRTANLVRQQILEGVIDYIESKTDMAVAADARRREERCGTVCNEIPIEWLRGPMARYFMAGDRPSQAAILN